MGSSLLGRPFPGVRKREREGGCSICSTGVYRVTISEPARERR